MASRRSWLTNSFALCLFLAIAAASPSPADAFSTQPPAGNFPIPSDGSGGSWSGASGSGGDWDGSGGAGQWSAADLAAYFLPPNLEVIRVCHVVLGSVAVLLILPGGAIFIRLCDDWWRAPWVHAGIQVFGLCMYATAAGLGIWMARVFQIINGDTAYLNAQVYHPAIGTIVLGLMFCQPFTEVVNHYLGRPFSKTSNLLGHFHLWLGRLLVILGIINGGLGFPFKNQIPDVTWSNAPPIIYGVIAFSVLVTYVTVVIIWGKKIRKRKVSHASENVIVTDEEMQGIRHELPAGNPLAGSGPTDYSRPQTGQTASSMNKKGFKSTAL